MSFQNESHQSYLLKQSPLIKRLKEVSKLLRRFCHTDLGIIRNSNRKRLGEHYHCRRGSATKNHTLRREMKIYYISGEVGKNWMVCFRVTPVNLVMTWRTAFGWYTEKELGFGSWNMCCNRLGFKNLTLTSVTGKALWMSPRRHFNEKFPNNWVCIIIMNLHLERICGPSNGRFRPVRSMQVKI